VKIPIERLDGGLPRKAEITSAHGSDIQKLSDASQHTAQMLGMEEHLRGFRKNMLGKWFDHLPKVNRSRSSKVSLTEARWHPTALYGKTIEDQAYFDKGNRAASSVETWQYGGLLQGADLTNAIARASVLFVHAALGETLRPRRD